MQEVTKNVEERPVADRVEGMGRSVSVPDIDLPVIEEFPKADGVKG